MLSQLSYEEMLGLTEENFEASLGGQPVTQGARRKILLSIAKLRERPIILKLIQQVCNTFSHPFLLQGPYQLHLNPFLNTLSFVPLIMD
jgi:hypothetical protein